MKKLLTRIILVSATVFTLNVNANFLVPNPPLVNAKGYILIDFDTGKVLAEKNADEQLNPASLTKMMTSYVIGREIQNGTISLTDMVTVSHKAWSKNFPESSKMFIEVGKEVSVSDLNRGIIIQSGNDACVAMAEHIAGSEDQFAQLMNLYAEKIGLHDSHFVNSHGLTADGHMTTARDMAKLGAALIRDVPEEYAIYQEKDFTFNNISQINRNSLLWDKSLNVDGIKTGHTDAAGYSLVSSATKGEMRLIAVVMGTASKRARKVESKKLLNYGFRFFETLTAYEAGTEFAKQKIYMGDKDEVRLGINQSTPITIPRGYREKLTASFTLDKELEAPINKGAVVGTLTLKIEDELITQYPLVSLDEVNEGSVFKKIKDFVKKKLDL
ncbi:serine hydrolase [Psychrosphaera sp. B3R10]|uniref:serine hydrolase n=1 Tax=unclassified Psychrosphaera TaxID=2641570 RepID=UPI001C08B0C7|nr:MULTISPECIES: serine hydrolase [unclassified Psychrosphaera]MBU2880978.1 serine hydrolase [Psychrosphaera sp. I2R16]MBU2990803.1 serine hydrolase [Psychrosphaera sp. B3R10]MDO6720499.1 serine hydrolase [Psychrosphaera sp. 1_MG-2023]